MRFVPTKFHAPLGYTVGAVLIAGLWILQCSDSIAATTSSIVLGIGLVAYSVLTDYERGSGGLSRWPRDSSSGLPGYQVRQDSRDRNKPCPRPFTHVSPEALDAQEMER